MNAIGQPYFTKSAAAYTVMESVCTTLLHELRTKKIYKNNNSISVTSVLLR
jgi:hypothetical protein